MRRRWPAVAVVLLVAVGTAGAHGWSVHADDQVVGDGTIVLGHVSMLEEGIVAVHLVEGGDPDPVLGSREFDDTGEFTGVRVDLDGDAWGDVEGTSWASASCPPATTRTSASPSPRGSTTTLAHVCSS